MSDATLSLEEARDLSVSILVRHHTSSANAHCVAGALLAAEIDGQKGHGLSRLPSYAAQAASGKVDGAATPVVAIGFGAIALGGVLIIWGIVPIASNMSFGAISVAAGIAIFALGFGFTVAADALRAAIARPQAQDAASASA